MEKEGCDMLTFNILSDIHDMFEWAIPAQIGLKH